MNGNPTANDLRKAAEYADGHRGRDVYLVYRPAKIAGDDRQGVIAVLQQDANDTLLCTVQTGYTQPNSNMNLTPIDYVEARSGSTVWSNLAERPQNPNDPTKWNLDALFWSESAIEKFMVPYYAGFLSKAEMDLLYQAYTDPAVFALGHRVPTIYTDLRAGGGSGGGGGGSLTSLRYGPESYSLGILTNGLTSDAEVISLAEYDQRR